MPQHQPGEGERVRDYSFGVSHLYRRFSECSTRPLQPTRTHHLIIARPPWNAYCRYNHRGSCSRILACGYTHHLALSVRRARVCTQTRPRPAIEQPGEGGMVAKPPATAVVVQQQPLEAEPVRVGMCVCAVQILRQPYASAAWRSSRKCGVITVERASTRRSLNSRATYNNCSVWYIRRSSYTLCKITARVPLDLLMWKAHMYAF